MVCEREYSGIAGTSSKNLITESTLAGMEIEGEKLMTPPKSPQFRKTVEKPGKKWKNEANKRRSDAKQRKQEFIRTLKEQPELRNRKIISPAYVGARNPYALANVINKEPVYWPDIPNKAKKLETIISMVTLKREDESIKYNQLFDPVNSSPLFPQNSKRKTGTLHKKITATPKKTLNFFLRCGDAQRSWVKDCASQPTQVWDTLEPTTDRINAIQEPFIRVDAPIQGCPADCWLISALSSIAWTDSWPIAGVTDYLELYDFLQESSVVANPPESTIPLINDGNNLIPAYVFSKFSETWPAIFELYMASLVQNTGIITPANRPNIASIGPGDPQYACACISMSVMTPDSRITAPAPPNEFDPDFIWTTIDDNCLQATASFRSTIRPTVAWTYCTGCDTLDAELQNLGCTAEIRAPTARYTDEILVASHAYSILGTMIENGSKYIILRNPWGGAPDNQGGYYLEAPVNPQYYHLADPCSLYLYPYDFGGYAKHNYLEPVVNGKRPVRDGIFGLRYDDFARFFAGFAWV